MQFFIARSTGTLTSLDGSHLPVEICPLVCPLLPWLLCSPTLELFTCSAVLMQWSSRSHDKWDSASKFKVHSYVGRVYICFASHFDTTHLFDSLPLAVCTRLPTKTLCDREGNWRNWRHVDSKPTESCSETVPILRPQHCRSQVQGKEKHTAETVASPQAYCRFILDCIGMLREPVVCWVANLPSYTCTCT